MNRLTHHGAALAADLILAFQRYNPHNGSTVAVAKAFQKSYNLDVDYEADANLIDTLRGIVDAQGMKNFLDAVIPKIGPVKGMKNGNRKRKQMTPRKAHVDASWDVGKLTC